MMESECGRAGNESMRRLISKEKADWRFRGSLLRRYTIVRQSCCRCSLLDCHPHPAQHFVPPHSISHCSLLVYSAFWKPGLTVNNAPISSDSPWTSSFPTHPHSNKDFDDAAYYYCVSEAHLKRSKHCSSLCYSIQSPKSHHVDVAIVQELVESLLKSSS